MNRIAKTAGLALVALLAATLPVAAQADVSGNWVLTVDAPESPGDIFAVFAQDGSTVTGTLEVPMMGGTEMSEGKIEDHTLSFVLEVDIEGQWILIEVEAEVDGDAMEGSFYVADYGSMPFRAVRTDG